MVINTATLFLLRGDSVIETSGVAGRIVKPLGESEGRKEYKPRKSLKSDSKSESKRNRMREYYWKNREKMLAQQKAHKASQRAALKKPMDGSKIDAVHHAEKDEFKEPLPAGLTIKDLIANGMLNDLGQKETQFTNLDIQRAFELTETEAFNFTQALVDHGLLTRDLKHDADGRVFYLFSTRRDYEPNEPHGFNP